jgi:20S proteasome alpha/beta subunit
VFKSSSSARNRTFSHSSRGFWRDVPNWERGDVTVCIAAACAENTNDPRVIAVTDKRVSSPLGSADTGLKMRIIARNWHCLTSGTESDILGTLKLLEDNFIAETVDETNVLHLVRKSLNERKRDKANECTQGKFAISYDEFLQHGKTRLPDDLFRTTAMEIDQIQVDAELIIFGYPKIGGSILIKTDKRCGASLREDFVTIGEGGYLAQASLLNRARSYAETFERALYNAYEAKKFAEGAPTVGPSTSILVYHKDGSSDVILPSGMEFLDEKFIELSRRPVPKDMSLKAAMFEDMADVAKRMREQLEKPKKEKT